MRLQLEEQIQDVDEEENLIGQIRYLGGIKAHTTLVPRLTFSTAELAFSFSASANEA